MIYGLTGDSKGFGRYIKARLIADGHSVIGFSRTNGYDLRYDIDRIVDQSNACDVFINNACIGTAQLMLLLEFHAAYKDADKHIISIGSWITDAEGLDHSLLGERAIKRSLRDLSKHLSNAGNRLRITYMTWGFHPGHPVLTTNPNLRDHTTIDQAVANLVTCSL